MKITAFIAPGILCLLVLGACATTRAGYETAAYSSVRTDGAFEVRDYPELTVASTVMDPARRDKDDRFMRLFRYIDGSNAKSEKIAMTTPVFMTEKAGAAEMQFVVPAAVAQTGAPKPSAAEVKVVRRPAQRCAVHRFSGPQSKESEAAARVRLTEWMAKHGLQPTGEPFFAYYDPPWTPGPMRRNEVLIPVKK